ncbi:MAG: DegV family protein [Anaerolineales bacterium]|nr:DegV family protein [Anaerolineales bacterium]
MVTIITDSTSDLGKVAEQRKIAVVPLSVNIAGRSYKDGVDIHAQQIFDLVSEFGELPSTAAPSAGDFERAFRLAGDDCIYIGISTRISASVQNALVAAKNFPEGKVRVIDSRNLSTGAGILALRAADLRDEGLDAVEIEKRILLDVPKGFSSFVIDTMEYLHKGGRCSALQAFMGSMLKIRPVIGIDKDGAMYVKEKARGTRRKALQILVDEFKDNLEILDARRVSIPHTGCLEDAEWIRTEIERLASPDEILLAQTGAVVCSHGGPNTIGLLYFSK